MLGTGGSALVAKKLGENKNIEAKQIFTMIIIFTILIGIIFSILGVIFIRPIALFLSFTAKGSEEEIKLMVEEAIKYGRILLLGQTLFMLQNVFQSFFVVDEKPMVGFLFVLCSGLLNMILDFILVGVLRLEIVGAAIATISGYLIGGIGPIIYFLIHKNDYISFYKTKLKIKPLLQSCFNGSSEFVNNISSSIVSIIFNLQLLRYFGDVGVNSYGIIMYISFVFCAIFIGYGGGIAPATSYHFGANNKDELNNILKKSSVIVLILSLAMCTLCLTLATPFAIMFSNNDAELIKLTTYGLRIYGVSFLFIGLSIYISTFFTALNNGVISAIISFFRTLVFQITFVLVFPLIFDASSIYWAIFASEVGSISLAFIFLITNAKKYGYFKNKIKASSN
jgi:Na+-driven multidrug efflux pump